MYNHKKYNMHCVGENITKSILTAGILFLFIGLNFDVPLLHHIGGSIIVIIGLFGIYYMIRNK